jgi:hypothetical protein
MKRLLLLFALLPLPMIAQIPPASSAFLYSGSSWTAALSSSTSGALTYTPPAIALYCYNSSLTEWVPADSSCFGSGTVSAGTAGQIAFYGSTSNAVQGASGGLTNGAHWAFGSGNSVDNCASVQEGSILGTCTVSVEEHGTSATPVSGVRIAQYWSPTGATTQEMIPLSVDGVYDYDNVTSGNASAFGAMIASRWIGDTVSSSGGLYGLAAYAEVEGNALQSNVYGVASEIDESSNSATAMNNMIGVNSIVNMYGSVDTYRTIGIFSDVTTNPGSGIPTGSAVGTGLYGISSFISVNHSTGSIPLAAAVDAEFLPTTGNIATSAMFYADSPDTADGESGTSTLHAGLYLAEQAGNGAGYTITSPYQIYSAGVSPSFFAGPMDLASNTFFGFLNTTASSGTVDSALCRSGSGTIQVSTSGTTCNQFGTLAAGNLTFQSHLYSGTKCANGASPAVCSTAQAGAVALPVGTGSTLTIDTTAVTANSQIFLTPDASVTISGVTCNTTLATLVGTPLAVTARVAGTSFTVKTGASVVIATNPLCFTYLIVN